MLAVALIAFTLFRYVGDPGQPDGRPGRDRRGSRRRSGSELGLNDPVLVQFARFVGNAARFDFGISYQVKQPVCG